MNVLKKKSRLIQKIARVNSVEKLRIFGSVATGEATGKSDVDFLVRMKRGRDLLDLIGFKQDMEDLLGHKVDVVTERGLSPYLRDRILDEAMPL
ncbi:MAG: nucleotidyltransferase family protein [Candidatus Omnitrophica bacterium]|nr:nucleotidyltransferase family protein [Candidatus Omnitrophota bacterium]